MFDNFENKNYIVTGGCSGIGRAIVTELLKRGANVAATYNSSVLSAKKFVESSSDFKGDLKIYKMDVSKIKEVENVISSIAAEFDNDIEGLVNNSGIADDSLMIGMSSESWEKVINVNLNGTFYVTSNVIKLMLKNKKGSIVNISSVNGIHGVAGQTNYSASKAGIVALTKSLSKEVARKKIRVNAVAPGYINTDFLSIMEKSAIDSVISQIPMKRLGEAEEIAKTVLFLLSDYSSYITGQVIIADGGLIS